MSATVGLIPAGAGSTLRLPCLHARCMAHPRWRGEHGHHACLQAVRPGSSPLARGAHPLFHAPRARPRLIPAGAGSTCFRGYSLRQGWAHPRWRGEHAAKKDCRNSVSGSSPLARGARAGHRGRPRNDRLIPAGAGSTPRAALAVQTPKAHPRWRGEHTSGVLANMGAAGSSPLARGAPLGRLYPPRDPGLIPASAGSTNRFCSIR